jgi:hypothetical protein
MGNLKIRNKFLRFIDCSIVIWIWCLLSIRYSTLNAHLFYGLAVAHMLALRCVVHFLISMLQTKTTLLAHTNLAYIIRIFLIFILFFNANCLLQFFVLNGNFNLILLIRVRKIINNYKVYAIILILLFW